MITYKGRLDAEQTYEHGDIVLDENGSTLIYVVTDNGAWFEAISGVDDSHSTRTHPTTCKCCGAVLTSWKCEYCGAEY